MKIVAIIPARMASTRFPGKPLANICGLPMIEHVRRRTLMAKEVSEVWVATPDREIQKVVTDFGGKVIMTSDDHTRPSDRVAEAADTITADIYVMVQGDEPMVTPEMVDLSVSPFLYEHFDRQLRSKYQPIVQTNLMPMCVNLTARIRSTDEFIDKNTIKVVIDRNLNAMYFTRQPIPTTQVHGAPSLQAQPMKQVCIIPFTRHGILKFMELEPTEHELAESIDMNRFLDNGIPVRMVETKDITFAVDTEADRVKVEALMKADPLLKEYVGSLTQSS